MRGSSSRIGNMGSETMMHRALALLGLMVLSCSASSAQSPSAAAECDRLAASPFDPEAVAHGVEVESIDQARAIPACEAALTRSPESPRLAYQLGRAYGAAGRDSDAVRLYRHAAEKGYAPAMADLGSRYGEGRGVALDSAEAVRWLRQAAEKGDVRAMDELGRAHLDGAGVPADEAEARRWFRRAADKGYGPSMHNLALFAEVESESWRGRAVQWYRQEAEKGIASAMAGLGWLYEMGHGVPQDDAEAVRWYRRAAEKGNQHGMAGLAFMYREGLGAPRDGGEAARWYRRAADQGSLEAMTELGRIYWEGDVVPRDRAEAVRWFRRASERGYALGTFHLALSYDGGEGVARDPEEAARLSVLMLRQRESATLLFVLKHNLGGLVLSSEGCQALQRRLGGAYGGPIDGNCGAEVVRATERYRARGPGPR